MTSRSKSPRTTFRPSSQSKLHSRTASSAIGTSRQPIATEQLAFRYAHIRFLTAGDEAFLPAALLDGSSIVATSEAMTTCSPTASPS